MPRNSSVHGGNQTVLFNEECSLETDLMVLKRFETMVKPVVAALNKKQQEIDENITFVKVDIYR